MKDTTQIFLVGIVAIVAIFVLIGLTSIDAPTDNMSGKVTEPVITLSDSTCVPDWVCGEWSRCINDVQVRECIDNANCGTEYQKPTILQDCILGTQEDVGADLQGSLEGENRWLFIMLIIFLIISLYIYLSWVLPERKKYVNYMHTLKSNVGAARKKGHSEEKIKNNLKKQGHHERHIKKAMKI